MSEENGRRSSDRDLEKGNLNIKIVISIVIGAILFVAWFYNSVIIPIKQVQVSIAQIQVTLASQQITFTTLNSRLNVVEDKLKIPR